MATDVIIRAKIGTAVVYSVTDDRADPAILDDILTGTIYPFLSVTSGITSVDWWLNGGFYATRSSAPFDLEGASGGDALPFDLLALDSGAYALSAVLTRSDGRMETVDTQFVVQNGPAFSEIPCPVTIDTPFIDVIGDPDADVLPNTIACTTIIGTPPVTTGTVVRSVAAIGVYPRLSGGPTQDDTNLEYLETSAYLGKRFGTQFSYVREVIDKTGIGVFLGGAKGMMDPAAGGIATLKNRSPNPIALQVWVPIQLESQGYKASFAAKRTNFQRVADGDYDTTVWQPFVDICVQYGWGTTSDNLWLEIGGEQDAQGIQNPDAFGRGNVDVCVAAQHHIAQFLHQRLPRVKIGVTRIGTADDNYYNAAGNPTGLSSIKAWENEVVANGDPDDYDFCFQAAYFFNNTSGSPAYLQGRMDTIHALCQQYGWAFGAHEWGLSSPLQFSTGCGDRPDFIDVYADWVNSRYPLYHHGCYFEGLAWAAMLPASDSVRDYPGFPNSRKRFRKRFGDGIEA